jgi:hypothetical protein
MKLTVFKLIVAAFTFMIGVSGTYLAWFAYDSPDISGPEEIQLYLSTPEPAKLSRRSSPKVATSIEQEWEELTGTEFCMVGSQYYSSKWDVEASDSPFVGESLRKDRRAAVTFLIKQIPDRSRTRIHVCNFDKSLKGELAVYCLQHVLKFNWYDLKDDYKRRFDSLNYDYSTDQALLRKIIRTKRGAKEMMGLWAARFESNTISIPE